MKSLLGAGALVLAMGLGAWSSDAFPHGDEPERTGHEQKSDRDDSARQVAKHTPPGQEKKAERERPAHPHGAPPGLEQRERQGPPPWSGGPDRRTEEPPGQAKKGA